MKAKPTYFSVQLFQLRLDILLSVARLFLEPFFICDLLVKKLNPSFPSCRAREIFFPSFLSFFLSFLQLTISHPLTGRTTTPVPTEEKGEKASCAIERSQLGLRTYRKRQAVARGLARLAQADVRSVALTRSLADVNRALTSRKRERERRVGN